MVRRRTQYLLRKAREREHILLGFVKALERIDEVIALIRASQNPAHAREGLQGLVEIDYSRFLRADAVVSTAPFDFTERQAQAIIERFGRYPHRNAVLGRASSDEELAFLHALPVRALWPAHSHRLLPVSQL